jgi:hypothetical protein
MENAGIFYGHLVYFTAIWYILWPCGNVVVIWYIFFRFSAFLCQEKSGNPVMHPKKQLRYSGSGNILGDLVTKPC